MGWVAWEGDEGGGGVGACVGRCGIGCPRELGFWHFIFQFWHFLLRTAPVLISIERYSALHHPGFHRGPEYRVLIYTCDCGLCLVRLSARKPWSRGARAVTRCTRRRAAAAATTTRAPTAAMATMAAPVSCAAGPAARSASASTHPPRPPSRSYRPQLPSSATVLSYRPQLPPSATALSYRPQLPPSATALSYRPQLPPSATALSYRPFASAASPCMRRLQELAEDVQGCRLAAQHIPCSATAAAMSRFPKVAQDEGGASDGMRRRSGEAKEPPSAVSEGVPACRKQAALLRQLSPQAPRPCW
jgi:hypothetical protein